LGCNYTVNIPNGTIKSVKIKPCTTDGTVLKLSKEGIKDKVGHQGDYFICVHYKIPETLSSVEKAHLEEIKRANS
jgi:DnaJ-class molecular chaperone